MRLAALLLPWLMLWPAPCEAVKAAVSVDVGASAWKVVRLRGLPRNGSLAMRVETSGPLNIFLVHESELRRLPEPVQPAFAGSLERRLAFKVTLPVAGTYYVVLDNRKSAQGRAVKVFFEVLRPPGTPRKAPARPGVSKDGKAI